MSRLLKWLGSIAASVIATLTVSWLTDFPHGADLPWERVELALGNILQDEPRPQDKFRIVLTWLEDDRSGHDTRTVEHAFLGIERIQLVRSARIVAASGAADEWRATMQQEALEVLRDWDADLLIAGRVKRSRFALSLWFIPRWGQGTLYRPEHPYKLEDVTLGDDFHIDLQTQLVAVALAAVAPHIPPWVFPDQQVENTTRKLAKLLDGTMIGRPGQRAILYRALGDGLLRLGKYEIDSTHLKQAVDAYREALKVYTPEDSPIDWVVTQNNLGNALSALGKRERQLEHLRAAVKAYDSLLKEMDRKQSPLWWAAVQNNLGTALLFLAELEPDVVHVEAAESALRQALLERTPERAPLEWAATQSNLGLALEALGKRKNDTELLEQAVAAHRKALQQQTQERTPLDWAMTQNNLGNALLEWGRRIEQEEYLKQAETAYRNAMKVHTRERVPNDWAGTQNNLGMALFSLGVLKRSPQLLQEAVDAFSEALAVLGNEGSGELQAMTQLNLDEALRELHELDR